MFSMPIWSGRRQNDRNFQWPQNRPANFLALHPCAVSKAPCMPPLALPYLKLRAPASVSSPKILVQRAGHAAV